MVPSNLSRLLLDLDLLETDFVDPNEEFDRDFESSDPNFCITSDL